MAKDPICGMEVDESAGLAVESAGQTYFFCSDHCRQTFLTQQKPTDDPSAAVKQETHSCCGHESTQGPSSKQRSSESRYICPMCDGVESHHPGECSKCGMALEPDRPLSTTTRIYTCPMHPEVEQEHPGTCPKCGMELESKTISAEPSDEDDAELRGMTRRFWVAVTLGVPVFLLAMLPMVGVPIDQWLGPLRSAWIQFALSTPVVLWAGWPFFVRGWRSVVSWNLNMFTLIALGVGAAYSYSAVATMWPDSIPESFKENGHVAVYFEAAAVIVGLILLGQVLELRARRRTNSAIRELLSLAPPTARVIRDGREKQIPVEEVQQGDTLKVVPGDKIPVDGQITDGKSTVKNR